MKLWRMEFKLLWGRQSAIDFIRFGTVALEISALSAYGELSVAAGHRYGMLFGKFQQTK